MNAHANTERDPMPADYAGELEALSLRPAWLALRTLTPPGKPIRSIGSAHWPYATLRPLLMKAGEIVPIEQAERRVLGLQNPAITTPRLATTPSIFLGMQLILPGEHAPAHRHTPSAARLVVEGLGAYTVVNGASLRMEPGDLLLTPPHHWHEHRHDGEVPMVWMDILDHPVAIPLETSYLLEENDPGAGYIKPTSRPDPSEAAFTQPGLVPYRAPTAVPKRYSMMRFPWTRTRLALGAMSGQIAATEAVHLMFVNPESGASLLETLSFSARMLRPGERIDVLRSSASLVMHVVEGSAEIAIEGDVKDCGPHDTVAAPTFSQVTIANTSSEPAFIIQIDDAPLQQKLGYYEDAVSRPFGERQGD